MSTPGARRAQNPNTAKKNGTRNALPVANAGFPAPSIRGFRLRHARSAGAIALAATLTAAAGTPADGGVWQSHDAIRALVRDHLANQSGGGPAADLEVEVPTLDPRLRLPACPEPLRALPGEGQRLGAVSVAVRCPGAAPWTLYVQAKVAAFATVLVATRPLPRGARLADSDLEPVRMNIAALPQGYVTNADTVAGKVLRQALAAGQPVRPGQLAEPNLVARGQQVTLRAARAGFEVSMAGTALANGRRGDRIQVRNATSGRVVEGEVMAAGMVDVAN